MNYKSLVIALLMAAPYSVASAQTDDAGSSLEQAKEAGIEGLQKLLESGSTATESVKVSAIESLHAIAEKSEEARGQMVAYFEKIKTQYKNKSEAISKAASDAVETLKKA